MIQTVGSKTDNRPNGFTLFAFTWAMACFFHQLSFLDWRWYTVPGLALSAAVILVLLKPSSWIRFAFLLVIDFAGVALKAPIHPNHIIFSWVVNGTMLAALILAARQESLEKDVSTRWYNLFAPWLRIELCILYFWAVFHKLNVSYFDVDCSCASKMHREISAWMPLLPGAKWAQYCAIYGTLIFEAGIPLLLLGRRTRMAGVIVGMLFHGLLAMHPHAGLFSFSSTMTALFTVFMPEATAAAMQPPRLLRKVFQWGLAAFALVCFIWILRRLLPDSLALESHLHQISKLGFLAYFLYLFAGLFIVVVAVRSTEAEVRAPLQNSWRTSPLLIVFPLLLILNGFGPYLGLRTQTSFSMFSNIQTENGASNHLIVPSGIQITNWQYDLVEIIDTNNPHLLEVREKNYLLPYLELRRNRRGCAPDMWVTFRRNGVIFTFDAARTETYQVLPPFNVLAQRYFYFRPVDRDPLKVSCKH